VLVGLGRDENADAKVELFGVKTARIDLSLGFS
jgi:hypothetical protein